MPKNCISSPCGGGGGGGGGREAVFSPFLPKKKYWVTGLCFPEIVYCKINIVDKPKKASLYYLPFLLGK